MFDLLILSRWHKLLILTQLLVALDTAVRYLCRCGGNKFFIKTEKSVLRFQTFLKQIKNDGWCVEQHFRNIESEDLLRIFPVNTVIYAWKVNEENKDRKKFSFLYK